MGHAAVFCNERSSAFFVSNMTRFGITKSWSVSVYSFQMRRVSCFVENKIKPMRMTQCSLFGAVPTLRLRN